ncbi:hypothetical protein B0H16DRAFT_1468663 [Mycena metata]|uniref:Uncharacterized protein n=1 Tax=Mycena metata TaxID=1033252 RepID=A0AAD7MU70_9AGAR|nr:hypothetical protein B0H16DRAFT_1468663 [Mycena metata]
MGAGIINNTNSELHYENPETNHKFTLCAKDKDDNTHCQMPCSNYHDDTIPWKITGKSIALWQSSGEKITISDDDWQFWVAGETAYTKNNEGKHYGSLGQGGKYILKIDDGNSKARGLTIYDYKNFVGNNGNGGAQSELIQWAVPNVATLLFE